MDSSNFNTNPTIKFSIVIPVYNVENFLPDCLNSLKNQTFKDFEVICINDGSSDNSLDILNKYQKNDSRFIVISQENQGQGIARNKGIDLAKGEYILFIDPDDFIENNTLETLYNSFIETNADIIQFDYSTCKENCELKKREFFSKKIYKNSKYLIKDNDIFNWHKAKEKNLFGISLSAWDKAYKASHIKRNNIKFAPNKHSEDHIFSISANLLADKILYLQKPLYNYRLRAGSSVNKASNDNFCIFENIELLKDFLIKNNFYNEYEKSFKEYIKIVLSWHYSNIPKENADKFLSKCQEILTSDEYRLLTKKINGSLSATEKIFSIKNLKQNGIKTKILTVLGFKIILPVRKRV